MWFFDIFVVAINVVEKKCKFFPLIHFFVEKIYEFSLQKNVSTKFVKKTKLTEALYSNLFRLGNLQKHFIPICLCWKTYRGILFQFVYAGKLTEAFYSNLFMLGDLQKNFIPICLRWETYRSILF